MKPPHPNKMAHPGPNKAHKRSATSILVCDWCKEPVSELCITPGKQAAATLKLCVSCNATLSERPTL